MVLVLDNFDSFTWNIVHAAAQAAPDAPVEVVRSDRLGPAEVLALRPSHVIVSPGPCGPIEAGRSVEVIAALAGHIPVLGICLGQQCIGAAFGMQIVRGTRPVHGKTSLIHHDGHGVLAGIASPMRAMRYHSLVVSAATIDRSNWDISAWIDEDGSRTVMGMRRRWTRAPLEGVQFHPESFGTECGVQVLRNFIGGMAQQPTDEPAASPETLVSVRSRGAALERA